MKNKFLTKIKGMDRRISGMFFLVVSILLMIYTGRNFLQMHEPDMLYPSSGLTNQGKLSDYLAILKDSPADTDVYYFKGELPGAKVLVMGGTHNDESSGQLSAITLLENARVSQGELIIIPRVNNSGSTYSQEMTGDPYYVELQTSGGVRLIKNGSRYANSAHQFPDPDVYINPGSAKYPGVEIRDLNRVYPGREDGMMVEQVAAALINFINTEKIDLVIDLHEAVPEHYVVNCLIGHDRAMELVAITIMGLQMQGIEINMFSSPLVPGFSHRSIGDHTDALVVLAETTNILQGAFRSQPNQQLLHGGQDAFYDILSAKEKIFVEYDSVQGVSLSERVGRHLSTVMELTRNLAYFYPDKIIEISHVPELDEVMEKGIEYFLDPYNNRNQYN
jgi:hypothetical protein